MKKNKKETTLKDLEKSMKKLRKKGYKPSLKGKKGTVKLRFD